jgi:hypothetical protein
MSRKANRFKVMGGLLVVAMAMFAVFAGQASAINWTTEALLKTGQEQEIGAQASGNSVLTGTVSSLPIELTAKKVEAVVGTKIKQTGEGVSGVATGTGALKYSELSLQKPVGCGPPASITTTGLKAELIKAEKLTSKLGFKLQPSSTTAPTLFATITLTGECALAGTAFKVTIPKEAYFCGEVEKLGTMLAQEPIRSSATINKECGGVLEAGGNPAVLTGTATGFSKVTPGVTWGAQ